MKKLLFILSLGLLVPLAQADYTACCTGYPTKAEMKKMEEMPPLGQQQNTPKYYTHITWSEISTCTYRYDANPQCSGDKPYKVIEKQKCPGAVINLGNNTYEINRCYSYTNLGKLTIKSAFPRLVVTSGSTVTPINANIAYRTN